MGFRELGKFNFAMLANQVWRLVHDIDSLFYRVFKAKYFPTRSIFDAKAKSGSYSWSIGVGTSVKNFKDSWLLGSNSG